MFRAPLTLPPLDQLLADAVGDSKALSRYLGVTPRTLARWRAAQTAPRAVLLALYWESRAGLAHLHADAMNDADQARAWVAALERELHRLRDVVRGMESAGQWDSANAPYWQAL